MSAEPLAPLQSQSQPLVLTADKVMRDLEQIRLAALEAGAFAPALRCVELQGKHIGLWRNEAPLDQTLEQLIAAVPVRDSTETSDV
ncbi:hypothetical protein SAMN02745126_05048 [Enhydrobacter aerosaccus]|uniref:Uncharacterized protein n=1 Tax=Enhydrobacter aerosaccus TaxID=225324 RepID=A0A1T4SRQ4_9HYPH|nr:hypothetical protein [Enhydrobacter aerosaccus]SKA30909.1 hypothetical protein SAMN02745126_05048 [Enhydrobacter aerosaccus]